MKVNKAVVLAAGKGTRFLPYTKSYPKEMLAVVDRPALQILVEEIAAAGICEVLLVISPEKEAVRQYFTPDKDLEFWLESQGKIAEAESLKQLSRLAEISFVCQENPDGTGKAVLKAEEWTAGQPFAVLNGDDVIYNEGKTATAQVAEAFEKCGKSVVGVQTVDKSVIHKYASCKTVSQTGRLYAIDDIVEKPRSEDKIFSLLAPLGRYVLTPDIFDVIRRTPPKKGGEVYLTDSLQIQAKNGGIYAYDFCGKRYDFGDKAGYLRGFTEYALRDPRFGAEYRKFLEKLLSQK